jgi:hypothetical protein
MFGSAIRYMCTFTGNKLSVCGFASNASWITQTDQFPGVMPVKAMQGMGFDTVVVVDGRGAFYHCGLPTGKWAQDIPPLSSFKQFLGVRYDDNDNAYIAALDTGGTVWIIGNPAGGGNWVTAANLTPPLGSGPSFGVNGTYMSTFVGTTLQVCGIATDAHWVSAAPFPGPMPVRAMYSDLYVVDHIGSFWDCIPPNTGTWGQHIPQLPRPFKEFMGAGTDYDYNGFLAALDTTGTGWLLGFSSEGVIGNWVSPPNLTPPRA